MENILNERNVAEKVLIAVGSQTSSLTISRQDIYDFCLKNNTRLTVVLTFLVEYLIPEVTDLNGEALTYRLNKKGLEFISKGCWSGIEKTEINRLQREADNKQNEIELLTVENRKNRKVAIIVGIIGGIFAIAAAAIALLST